MKLKYTTEKWPDNSSVTKREAVGCPTTAPSSGCIETDKRNVSFPLFSHTKREFLFVTGVLFFFFASCAQNNESGSSRLQPGPQAQQIESEGIHIEGAWARPAEEGRISATYFLISNFSDEADTLLSVESDAAQLAEIHESFEQEDGMMGMREAGELEIPAQSTVRLEQGGLHVMLIQLTRTLEDGDTFELILTFANSGEQTVKVETRL